MIVGIGTDLIEIARIEDKLESNEAFKTHVFSAHECEYCEGHKRPGMHFAARWAVKEAFLKAFGVQFIGNQRLPQIETVNDEYGKPSIVLHGEILEDFRKRGLQKTHVSISHTDTHATAYVIIEA